MNPDRGVLYIASGHPYIEEAKVSAKSVERHMPDIGKTLATDEAMVDDELFDQVIELSTVFPKSGISTIRTELTPYERTLFLDSDTYISEPVYELFKILDDHDIAFSQSPGRLSVTGLPDPWREFNTGVIALRNSEPTRQFLQEWHQLHESMLEEESQTRNQPSFTKAVHQSDINYFVLPREYNVRVIRFGYLANKAKIVHGRGEIPLKTIESIINQHDEQRVFWPYIDWNLRTKIGMRTKSDQSKFRSLLIEAQKKYNSEGLVPLFSACLRKVRNNFSN